MHLLEAKARMMWVLAKELVGELRLGLHLRRQGSKRLAKPLGGVGFQRLSGSSGRVLPARCSSSASFASRSSAPGFLAKDASQRPSTFTSSRMAAARASWSAGGSFEAASKAFLSLLVMASNLGRRGLNSQDRNNAA